MCVDKRFICTALWLHEAIIIVFLSYGKCYIIYTQEEIIAEIHKSLNEKGKAPEMENIKVKEENEEYQEEDCRSEIEARGSDIILVNIEVEEQNENMTKLEGGKLITRKINIKRSRRKKKEKRKIKRRLHR